MRNVNRKSRAHLNQSTVIKQYISTEKPRRQRRNATKSKVLKSTLDELARATATINKLLNDNDKLINENK